MASDALQVQILPGLPLPKGWQRIRLNDGLSYFLDYNTMTTHWNHPLERDPSLPAGWETAHIEDGIEVFYDHTTSTVMSERPRIKTGVENCSTVEELEAFVHTHCQVMRFSMPKSGQDLHTDHPNVRDSVQALITDPKAAATINWSTLAHDDVDVGCLFLNELLEKELKDAKNAADITAIRKRYAHAFKTLLTLGEPLTYAL